MYQNPFLPTLVVPYIRTIKRDVPLMKDELHPGDYYDFEATPSTRMYRTKDNYDLIKELSVTGYRLFMWITFHVGVDMDYVRLNESKLAEIFNCSGKTITRARTELLQKTIIAKREANEYWLNPRLFASSSRLSLFPAQAVCVLTRREQS